MVYRVSYHYYQSRLKASVNFRTKINIVCIHGAALSIHQLYYKDTDTVIISDYTLLNTICLLNLVLYAATRSHEIFDANRSGGA